MRTEKSLFHYTTQAGLLGILEKKVVWATHIHYLTDYAEFEHAVTLLKEVVAKKRHHVSDQQKELIEELQERLKHVQKTNIFVTSFSEAGDLLSLWRGYCPGGSGFSIAFCSEALKNEMKAHDVVLDACIYDADSQVKIIENLLNDLLDESPSDESIKHFLNGFYRVAPILKNPSFFEEKEWRLIYGPLDLADEKVKFRSGRSMLKPYVELVLPQDLHITSVTVGPSPHTELSAAAVEALLQRNKVKSGKVQVSTVPFRGW